MNADVAQLVARNLAKVQVAGSNPVVRSIYLSYLSSSYKNFQIIRLPSAFDI